MELLDEIETISRRWELRDNHLEELLDQLLNN